MLFTSYIPSAKISDLVTYFWTLETTDEDDLTSVYRFVPDGYVDWIFHLGTPWQCQFPDEIPDGDTGRFHVFGQIKQHVDLKIEGSDLNLFGVKFNPWAVKGIWNVDMHYLTNSCLDIEDLELPEIKSLQERVYEADSNMDRIEILEDYLSKYAGHKADKSLKKVLMSFSEESSNLDMEAFGFTARRMEQRFKSEIGIPAKLFYRTQRINNVINDLRKRHRPSLTKIALDHNYYDQSHFIKDFKQFTGLNPSKFLKSIRPDGDILNLRVSA